MTLLDHINQAIAKIKREMNALPDEDSAYDEWRVLNIQLCALMAERDATDQA